ncbi:MAG: polymer-forming cytoskeletal protein [Actinomycetota bacterium]|nr:polymer-forming cytoskeletal protein [Actinomycetota bacterium]
MFFVKNSHTKNKRYHSIITNEASIEGKIYSPGSIKIEGNATGEIVSRKEVAIGQGGKVRANIKAKNIVIEGNFLGNIILIGEAKITSTGKLFGNLIQKDAFISIEAGGLFRGKNILTDNEKIFDISNKKIVSNIKIKPRKTFEY